MRDVNIILDNNTGSEKSQFKKILEALSKWRDPSEIDMEIDSDCEYLLLPFDITKSIHYSITNNHVIFTHS